jgi:molecular chaperone GrpE
MAYFAKSFQTTYTPDKYAMSTRTEGQFDPKPAVGSIIDNPTFAHNTEKMTKKDMTEKEPVTPENEQGIDINTDENMSGTSHLNEPVAEESEIEKLRAELAEMKDKLLRKTAEFDNFRKRNAKERLELIVTAGREVITEMLDVLDDCDRAQKQFETSDDVNQLKDGVTLIFNKLRNKLQARGLKQMESVNTEFNTDLHEAITEIPAPNDEMKGKVMDEVIKGYYLNDKIIRFAKVVVGK